MVSAAEKVLLKFEKHLPSTDIQKFVVTRAVADNPDWELERLLQDPLNPEMLKKFEILVTQEKMTMKKSILDREAEFKRRYGMFFREGRIDLIVERMIEKGYDVNTVFEEVVEIQRLVGKILKGIFNAETGFTFDSTRRPLIGSQRLPWKRTGREVRSVHVSQRITSMDSD